MIGAPLNGPRRETLFSLCVEMRNGRDRPHSPDSRTLETMADAS